MTPLEIDGEFPHVGIEEGAEVLAQQGRGGRVDLPRGADGCRRTGDGDVEGDEFVVRRIECRCGHGVPLRPSHPDQWKNGRDEVRRKDTDTGFDGYLLNR